MKNYFVRLRNYNDSIIDGEYYKGTTAELALLMYKNRCKKLGIVCIQECGDHITVEETDLEL